jgi:hypothetical protein
MFGLFKKRHNRIGIIDDNIFIDNQKDNIGEPVELETVFKLTVPTPEIKVFENQNLVHTFRIDTLLTNKDLTGQFLHCSIRILSNSAVMIDGIISQSDNTFSKWTDNDYEAIRLQPFFLSDKNDNNIQLKGKGLFERGLHFRGTVTPTGVRNICICDSCNLSFTIQHFHSGFSELQYFYSTDSKETLIVPYGSIENLPTQLPETVDQSILQSIESKLPKPSGEGTFKYYNSFKCPHCLAPYIDFEKHNAIRATEYYGNTYINQNPKRWTA